MKNNWLKEHIAEVLAVGAALQWIVVMLFVLFREVKSNETTTMMILTSSTNIFLIVLSFYFGSSQGSKDKQKKLDEIAVADEKK